MYYKRVIFNPGMYFVNKSFKQDIFINLKIKIYVLIARFINKIHAWIKNHPLVIHYPNVKDLVFVKIIGTLLKKNNLLQISVRELTMT